MQHVHNIETRAGQYSPVASLRVTTMQPSLRIRIAQRMQATGVAETITEVILATMTFSLVGGLLFGLYRALESYTIIPLP